MPQKVILRAAGARASVLALDLGATTIKGALVHRGALVARERVATPGLEGASAVLDAAVRCLERLRVRAERTRICVDAIGIASCGMIDPVEGVVVDSTETMRGWRGTRLRAEVERRMGLRVAVENDGRAAALAEARLGAGAQGAKICVMLTLGTGVGGGVAIDGTVISGAGSLAGALGHLDVSGAISGRAPRCACGRRGCLEAYLSAFACRRDLRAEPKEVFAAARRSAAAESAWVQRGATALGAACAHIAHVLNPDVIAIGGGIGAGWPQLSPTAAAAFHKNALPRSVATTRLVRSRLGADASLLGAAVVAWELLEQRFLETPARR